MHNQAAFKMCPTSTKNQLRHPQERIPILPPDLLPSSLRRRFCLVIALVLVLVCQFSTDQCVAGQNPLRGGQEQSSASSTRTLQAVPNTARSFPTRDASSQPSNQPPQRQAFRFSDSNTNSANDHLPSRQSPSSQGWNEPIRDPNVMPADFQRLPNSSSLGKGDHFPKRNETSGQPLELITKLSVNLFFVLLIALGIILMVKRFYRGAAAGNDGKLDVQGLRIRESLRLDGKSSIRLIEWRSNQFLVACDQNGIQSVNPVSPSFSQTLNELDEEPPAAEATAELDESANLRKLLASIGLAGTEERGQA